MALDRRTLRELIARPLIDEARRRVTLLFVATGRGSRSTLHAISVSVKGAQRRAQNHVVIEIGANAVALPGLSGVVTEVHLVGVAPDEDEHPVTRQLASRAQAVLAAPEHPRALRAVVGRRADDDPVAAYSELLEHAFEQVGRHFSPGSSTPPEEDEDPAPPSVGTRRCDLALLGVRRVTAQELLTALDAIMAKTRYRRCSHAGGGRDFVLLRGRAGAGLRVVDDRAGGATDLAVQLSSSLEHPLLVATVTAEQELDPGSVHTRTKIAWTLESVNATGIGVAYRDSTTLSEPAPRLPLDERVAQHIAAEVFTIAPEKEGLRLHYERV